MSYCGEHVFYLRNYLATGAVMSHIYSQTRNMSFGWSASDIAAAVAVAYDIYEALDRCDGAANAYREAVSFLKELTRTLEPLKIFTTLRVCPTYGKEIMEEVDFIKAPLGRFLRSVLKYAPSLDPKARKRHHRHIVRELQWYVFISKEVLDLRDKIKLHMRVLGSLMNRLIL